MLSSFMSLIYCLSILRTGFSRSVYQLVKIIGVHSIRIAGINIPDKEITLTAIMGIANTPKSHQAAGAEDVKIRELSEEQIDKLRDEAW